MKCPTCRKRLGLIKSTALSWKFAIRKAVPCPYCRNNIYWQHNPTSEYLKLLLFTAAWLGTVLFLLAVIFSGQIGFTSALLICFWLWVIAVGALITITFFNSVAVLLGRVIEHFKKPGK